MDSHEIKSDHPHAPYNRPNLKWVCGHAKEGCPTCPLGPSSKGECRASGQCRPERKGDRYYCTRPASLGGKCSEGPLPDGSCAHIIPPCSPSLSARALRGRICLTLAIITVALLVFLLSGPSADKHASAGPLTSHHATTTSGCMDCHTGTDGDTALSADLFDLHARARANAQKCLDCHNLGNTPFNPHGLPTSTLAELTEARQATPASGNPGALASLAAQLAAQHTPEDGKLACSACHTEHKGPEFDITAMSDAQCQSCHQTPFHDFAADHPAFDNYPYSRRTHIIFDHESHLLDHFNKPAFKDRAADDCLSCHQIDNTGTLMQTKGFEATCAACHGDQIEGAGRAGALGIAYLQLPGIDTQTLTKQGYPVGDWPEYADGDLTPFMIALLRQNEQTAQYLDTLDGVNRFDLRKASPAELEAATGLLWAVKGLFFDALTKDQEHLQKQILPTPEETISRSAQQRLSAQLPFDALRSAQQSWFPNLLIEVPQYRDGSFTPPAPATVKAPAPEMPAAATTAGNGDLLLADDNDGDLLAPNASNDDALLTSNDDALLTSNDDALLTGNDDALLTSNDDALLTSNDDALLTSNDDALLTSNDDALLGGGDELLSGDSGGDLLLTGNDNSGDLLLGGDDAPADLTPAPVEKPAPKPVELKDPEVWSSNGGWYRSDTRYALYYRPTGHADSFITEWINQTAPRAGASGTDRVIFDQLTADKAPGLCMKCHSVDIAPDGQYQVNWTAPRPIPHQQSFTNFRHAPHFNRHDDSGCIQCHTLKQGTDYAAAFEENRNPHQFSSNFENMNQALCATCHNQTNATDSCLLCHNYHVGTSGPKLPGNNLKAFLKETHTTQGE